MVCKGRTAYLRGEMLHIRRETISHYIFKHIGYADLESGEWVKWRSGESRVAAASDLFKGHLRYRQWARRHLWHRLPGRPLWRLFFMYIVRLGFLDGAAGWHLARLMACYEYMIGLLFAEKRRGGDHLVEAAPAARNHFGNLGASWLRRSYGRRPRRGRNGRFCPAHFPTL
jgi:hypothetical protein